MGGLVSRNSLDGSTDEEPFSALSGSTEGSDEGAVEGADIASSKRSRGEKGKGKRIQRGYN